MGKQSKNGTGSGGDERNMYYRRYKSTSNPSKASTNENLIKTDSESSSRSYNTGTSSQQNTSPSKSNAKSKLRTPVKAGLGQSTNRANKPDTNSDNKEVKKPAGTRAKSQLTKMKQESATTEKKQIPVNMEADNKEVVEQIESPTIKESTPAYQENGDSNGVYNNGASFENNFIENQGGQISQNGEGILEIQEKAEEFNLELEVDENCFAFDEMLEVPSQITADENTEKQLEDFMEEIKDDSKVDSESCSVDVVESTTSELPEATESTAGSENKEKINENDGANSEAAKEVKDGVKTSQSEEETKADQSTSDSQKETTFGKTLRTISGRHSIGRMRHMKLRDRQPSPNSSLFVNTSSASVSEEHDFKSTHRRTPTADLNSTNGTEKVERKRKLIDESFDTQKKIKTEENSASFLSSSIEMLKKPFRRSAKASTSKKSEKEQIHLTGGELVPYGESNKKWCLIM